jgi:3-oxoacyl-[acyl-carrier protein] reductase
VFCIDNQEDLAKEIANEVGGIAWTGDARDREQVERAVGEARTALGRIDILVDIVGMARYVDSLTTSDDDWEWTYGMVFRHAVLFSQAAGRAMAEDGGGSMVFVASISGITAAPHHAFYGAAKAALISWVRSLGVELGPSNIRVNAVAPGVVWTPRVQALIGDRGREYQAAQVPLGRVAQTSEVASAILFLASDLSSHVNGQTLVVDGGVTAKFPFELSP